MSHLRAVRTDPPPEPGLLDRLTASGARLVDGRAVANDFGDVAREHAAVRRAVGIGVRDRLFTRFEGPHATRFLQGMVTQDVAGLAVGDARYALMLTPKARVLSDLRLLRLGDELLVADSEPDATPGLRSTLVRYRLGSRVAIEPLEDWACLAVAGPRAGMLLLDAFGVLPRVEPPEGTGTLLELDGTALHAVASTLYGEKAVEILGPAAGVAAAWAALSDHLPRHGGAPFGTAAEEILRVEAGVPRQGAELDEQVMPAEVGVVERAVSFTKGCYIGQEPVARLHYRGHANRVLRALLLDGAPPAPGSEVVLDGKTVGRVTSAVRSPSLGRTVALGVLRRELEDGRQVLVTRDGEERPAEVAPVPVYSWRGA
ncbi:MAG: tRNA-modifying protein YgfZ [uncultured Thermoleophilia bacterium]|uniref:tRNA-modifying protein YgfZ n=1 Tax=uncultured Thermoleophilia bacterium TaxID=1497501 RepID=A0A6J4TMG7_9ACTN|nr:MAG: tRNA-modifying protein YgfZ [uncultured Thermoleophilia bacterium]